MVTAYTVQSSLCLAQEGTCGKGRELAAMKALLDVLVFKGCVVTWMNKPMRAAWKKLGGTGMRQIGRVVSIDHRYAIGSCGVRTVARFAKASGSH